VLFFRQRKQGKRLAIEETKLRQKNNELADSLKKNDLLVQEVHHRVKNNLQFVNSMISLQASASVEKHQKDALKNLQKTVMAVAFVHDHLSENKDYKTIDAHLYIEEIVEYCKKAFAADYVIFEKKLDRMRVEALKASELGMIITELITNSLKHAFVNLDYPKIKIDLLLTKDGKEVKFSYSDNGTGYVKNAKEGLGTRLINSFVSKLNGRVAIQTMGCFKFDLNFPL